MVIADDQQLVRSGVRMILEGEPDMQVVGEARDGQEAADLVATEEPDVLLMDVRMPGEDGIAATRQILAHGTRTRVLMLTTFDIDEYVYDALRAGASGFLLKDMPGEDIVTAVRQAARGADSLLAPAVTRRLIDRFAASQEKVRVPPAALRDLTARELEVLRLVARALSNAEIAAQLSIAETTVKTHVARVLMKLGLRDRVQAVIVAYEAGLIC
ncbi:MAG TPA: response regulator transcription factor [Streptosporangiaceae bacterium]